MKIQQVREEFKFNNQARKLADKTISNYDKMLGYFIKYELEENQVEDVEEVQAGHIRGFLKKMQQTEHTVSYLNDLLKVLKVFFTYCAEEEYIPEDKKPTRNVKNFRKSKILIKGFSQEEMMGMINYYQGRDFLSMRNRVILMLFWDTGIRCCECVGMKLDQIHSDYFLIHGKGDKERVVPKSPMLSKWFIKYLAVRKAYFQYRANNDYVFPSRNGRKLTTEMIDRRIIGDAAAAIGVRDEVRASAHTIRHAYAEFSLINGMDIYTLSRLLGHSNIKTTQTYLEGIEDKVILKQGEEASPLMTPLPTKR